MRETLERRAEGSALSPIADALPRAQHRSGCLNHKLVSAIAAGWGFASAAADHVGTREFGAG
jgi:hypothetical protein